MKQPFPWFGGKTKAAPEIWRRFGNVPNFIDPFFGGGAVLLNRPHEPGTETINDLDCYVANFFRATQAEPMEVARWADWQVNEADLHAMPANWTIHRWKTSGGYGSQGDGTGRANASRECIWFSPHCLPESNGIFRAQRIGYASDLDGMPLYAEVQP